MAKARIEILGDSSSYQKAVRDSLYATKKLNAGFAQTEHSFGRASRGALAGSGAFRSLGRSIAFASGGFLAFASAAQFFRTSIDAARGAAVTQKQLAAQFRASGIALGPYQKQIEDTNLKLSALAGINKDELDASFTTIFRSTNNVTKALQDEKVAADIAAGRHISLATASIAVGKAAAGSTTSLRRLGIQLPKGTTGIQAIAIAAERFKGQAAAGATAQSRFSAVLHDSEVIIGTGLLPTLNKFLASGTKWLDQMNRSGRLQKDVSKATHDVGEAFRAGEAILKPFISGFRTLERVSGGTKHAIELLATAFLALEIRAKLLKWGLITTGIESVGGAAVVATGEVTTLSGALARLGGLASGKFGPAGLIGPIGFAVASSGESKGINTTGGVKFKGGFVNPKTGNWMLPDLSKGGKLVDTGQPAPGWHNAIKSASAPIRRGIDSPSRFAPSSAGQTDPRRRGVSLQGQFNLAELKLAQAQLTATSADDRRILSTEAAIVRVQLTHVKTLKGRIALTQQLAGILGQIQGIDQADAQAAKDTAKAQRDRAQAALQAREFRVLGLDPTGQPFNRLAGLRRELKSIRGHIGGTTADTKKNEGILGNINKLLFGKDAHSLTKDVRDTIKQMLDAIQQELGQNTGGPVTRYAKANTAKLLAGLGLSPAQVRAARARLSQLGAGGTVPSSSAGASHVTVHTTIQLDGRKVAVNTTKHQQKSRRRNPSQRRGAFAGG